MQRLTVLGLLALSSAAASAADLTVISFGGAAQKAQDAAFYQPFSQQTGVKVVAGDYNGEMDKIRSMLEKKLITWDVVEVESPELIRGCSEGLFEKLDWNKINEINHFVEGAVSECGVGIFVWSTALAYNARSLGGKVPRSWADFWNVTRFPGKRALRKGAKYTLEFALLADGVRMENVYKELATETGVDRAFRKLDQLKPNIQWWESGAQPVQWLANGEVVMSSAYNGRVASAQQQGQSLNIVWNQSIYDLDYWVIVKGSPNKETAYKFLQLASQAPNQMAFANAIPYGPVVKEALVSLKPEIANNLPTNRDNLMVAMPIDTRFWVERGAALEARFQSWLSR